MRILTWALRGFIFFTLFAFALNNQAPASVHWFFGVEWRAPMVFVVLAAFAAGCAVGVLAMVPSWWQHRRAARSQAASSSEAPPAAGSARASDFVIEHPPREGL